MSEDPTIHYVVSSDEQTTLGAQILTLLTQARAANIRITGAQMAQRLEEKNDRRIRAVIEKLIEQGHLIAASNSYPMGYYLIQDSHEAAIYEATLRSRALKTLKRLKNFRRALAIKFGGGHQLPLFAIEQAVKELER